MSNSVKTFIEFLKKNKNSKILIYVYADWCDKCRLDNTKIKNLVIYKVNSDIDEDLVNVLDVRVLPYFMIVDYDVKQNDIVVNESFDNALDLYAYLN